jgi:hypothetical protein
VGATFPPPPHTPATPAGVELDPESAAAHSVRRRGEAGGGRRAGKAQ